MVRTGPSWGFPASAEAGEQGPVRVCVCACVSMSHTQRSSPAFRHLYSSPAGSRTSSPPNCNALTQTNSSSLQERLFPRAGAGGQGCGAPSLPFRSLPGRGPALLPRPFLQAGLVCSPQAIDGPAAAYSKSEEAVLGRAFEVPQAANRPSPTGAITRRGLLPFPARPLAFPAPTHRVSVPVISAKPLSQGFPTFPEAADISGAGAVSAVTLPALGPGVQESHGGRMLEQSVLASTVPKTTPQPPSCCCFLLSLPSGHRLQCPEEGLGDFSAFLGEHEICAPVMASG